MKPRSPQSRAGAVMTETRRRHLAAISRLGVLGRRDRARLEEAVAEHDLDKALGIARDALARARETLTTRLAPTPERAGRLRRIETALRVLSLES
jgi:hypothetical protein